MRAPQHLGGEMFSPLWRSSFSWHCQVASGGREWAKPAALESGCRRNFGNLVPGAEGGIASHAILVGIEVMTTEVEMAVDPTVGRKEALRMTR